MGDRRREGIMNRKVGVLAIKVDRDLKRNFQSLLALRGRKVQGVLRGPVEDEIRRQIAAMKKEKAADRGAKE
jgi:hypothetical protein